MYEGGMSDNEQPKPPKTDAPAEGPNHPLMPPITIDDFIAVDIRAGRVLSAERVPKSDKLLRLQVDFGSLGERQVLAGIGKSYSPEGLVGQKYAFLVNLPPRKMMGLESHGMILAAGGAGRLSLLHTDADVGDRFG